MIAPRAGGKGGVLRGMRPLAAVLVLLAAFLGSPAAHADFAKGKAAFAAGNYTLAYTELIEDAQNGNPEAEFMIGEIAAAAAGKERSYALAAQWYRLAAAKGFEPANLALALLYLHGAGGDDDPTRVAADPAQAAHYLEAAAKGGDAEAQALLGQLYMEGKGVPKNADLAWRYTLAAANHGIALAEYNAGLLVLDRSAAARDLAEAYKWFALAAEAQYPGADQDRRFVMGQMTREQLARAQALVSEFRPAP
ncbi:MAG TPA: tetratricopeptide repeat protein [Alphaproteobacteria bacterium]|nr:tetratricopeptide repeat protein [Alphaproteobacteria bacterium]